MKKFLLVLLVVVLLPAMPASAQGPLKGIVRTNNAKKIIEAHSLVIPLDVRGDEDVKVRIGVDGHTLYYDLSLGKKFVQFVDGNVGHLLLTDRSKDELPKKYTLHERRTTLQGQDVWVMSVVIQEY